MSTALFPSTVPEVSAAITVGPLPPCAAEESTTTTAPFRTDCPAKDVPPSVPILTPASEVLQAWPRSAQWATAFLLGLAVALIAVYSLGHLRSGSRPMELQPGAMLAYRVDLNHASRAELLQLPGIGPNMVQRIEEYRQAQGGFRSVEDLTRIKGFGPAILERLRPWVVVETAGNDPAPLMQPRAGPTSHGKDPTASKNQKVAALTGPIDVNHASIEELRKLPGIGPKLSQRIVDAREKAKFQSVDELRRVPGIGPKTLERLRPYVAVRKDPASIASMQ
jgi:competence protein ComEA